MVTGKENLYLISGIKCLNKLLTCTITIIIWISEEMSSLEIKGLSFFLYDTGC